MRSIRSIAALLLVLTCAAPAFAATGAPVASAVTPVGGSATDVVKNFYATLTDTMKLGFGGRYKKLEPALRQAFNLQLMTRISVGPVWSSATPAEQDQLIKAFSQFSIASYAARFSNYGGEQFNVTGEKPTPGGGVIVETNLKPKDSDAVALNYLMRQDDKGVWRIVDVFMNGTISELATRRAEFASVIKRDGISALVNSLGEKSKQMGPT